MRRFHATNWMGDGRVGNLGAIVCAQIPAGMRIGLAPYLQAGYRGSVANLREAAERMPPAEYGFKPSTMAEARTFAAVIGYAADGILAECAIARGVTRPLGSIERSAATKVAVMRELADAVAFCDPAFAALTEASTAEFVSKGPGELARGAVLAELRAHNAEMFGISTVYLRAKNLVSPGSR
jgi:hypothetical protein